MNPRKDELEELDHDKYCFRAQSAEWSEESLLVRSSQNHMTKQVHFSLKIINNSIKDPNGIRKIYEVIDYA